LEDNIGCVGAIGTLVILVLCLFSGLFAKKDVAIRTLENQGFADVLIVDKAWFFVGFRGCDATDAARFTAIAKNPRDKEVTIYVCAGWPFKGGTIRSR